METKDKFRVEAPFQHTIHLSRDLFLSPLSLTLSPSYSAVRTVWGPSIVDVPILMMVCPDLSFLYNVKRVDSKLPFLYLHTVWTPALYNQLRLVTTSESSSHLLYLRKRKMKHRVPVFSSLFTVSMANMCFENINRVCCCVYRFLWHPTYGRRRCHWSSGAWKQMFRSWNEVTR